MTRFFDVFLKNNNNSEIIYRFRAIIEKKSQTKGKFGGDVKEDLFFTSLLFEQISPNSMEILSINLEQLKITQDFINSNFIELKSGRYKLNKIGRNLLALSMKKSD